MWSQELDPTLPAQVFYNYSIRLKAQAKTMKSGKGHVWIAEEAQLLILLTEFPNSMKLRCLSEFSRCLQCLEEKQNPNPSKTDIIESFYPCCSFSTQQGLKQKQRFCLYSWKLCLALARVLKVIFKTRSVQNWYFQANTRSFADGADAHDKAPCLKQRE